MSFEERHKEGYELLHEKDLDKSLDVARSLQRLNPDAPEGFTLEGEVMQKLNQWDTSIKSFDDAIEKDSDNGRLYNLRGYSYLNVDKPDKAKKDFERAIALDNLPAAHRNLVLYKLMNGEGQQAIQYLLDRIKSDPKDVENWILMGDLMKKGGHDAKAKTYYEQALKMDPGNEYVKNLLEE
ncbi:tetratricopeptide repeat protein [Rhodohalobacter sp. SW132]|uniref:tetratricopeptide repeat protein n=1 Tax=Rhodohalobacter sp. SW132 TaxID=2293433 RepID=UPI000E285AC2|nr:tetratricopeptide repeat protein [Rhodohalobacter sp. SW132]REL38518.1 tetratricopeptide repeat protein [Rhodohalobacter sp. SW132]